MATQSDPVAAMRTLNALLEQALAIADGLSEHVVAALICEGIAQATTRLQAMEESPPHGGPDSAQA